MRRRLIELTAWDRMLWPDSVLKLRMSLFLKGNDSVSATNSRVHTNSVSATNSRVHTKLEKQERNINSAFSCKWVAVIKHIYESEGMFVSSETSPNPAARP
jgi:hypothetical protein